MDASESRPKSSLCFPRLAFALSVVLVVLGLFANPEGWKIFLGPHHHGVESKLYPFLDMHGRLAAFEAHRLGIDILRQPNPLDPLQRTNVKPTWPLHLTFLGLGLGHLAIAGFVTVVGFLAIIVAVIRPRRWIEMLCLTPVVLSPPVLLGIERANDDLVYLILLSAIVPLLSLKTRLRFWLAWAVVFLLAPAKYYPGAAFAVFLLEVREPRQLLLLFLAGVAFLGLYLGFNYEEVIYLKDAVPQPTMFLCHGAELLGDLIGASGLFSTFYLLILAVLAAWVVFRPGGGELKEVEGARWYLLGYSVFLFCFILNSNYDYRMVYILLMMPLLLSLWRMGKASVRSKLAALMVISLIPAVWIEMLLTHYALGTTGWMLEHTWLSLVVKNTILAVFLAGATVFAAELLRPNLRRLWSELRKPAST